MGAPTTTRPARRPVTSKRFDSLSAAELYGLLRLRCDVFVVEQNCAYPELDGRDTETGTVHHWIVDDSDPTVIVAALRSLAESDGTTRIGRVVTAAAHRRAGLARLLVDHIGSTCTTTIVLDAQAHLVDWYRRSGYEVAGAGFVEDGIAHVPMRRPLHR